MGPALAERPISKSHERSARALRSNVDSVLADVPESIRFAGQITGCEGYVESAAIGLLAGRFVAAELGGTTLEPPPPETALGALLGHITGGADAATYQPMNVNFGLFPPVAGKAKRAERRKLYTDRARAELAAWLSQYIGEPKAAMEPSDAVAG